MRGPVVVPAALALAVALTVGYAAPVQAAGSKLENARADANAAAAELSAAEAHVAELEGQVAGLEQQVTDGRAKVADLGARVRDLALAEFMTGDEDGLSALDVDLGAGARAEAFAGFVSSGTTQSLERYRRATQDLELVAAELGRQRASMDDAVADLGRRNEEAMAEVVRLERIDAERRAREEAAREERLEAARKAASQQAAAAPAAPRTRAATATRAAPLSGAASDAASAAEAASARSGEGFLCPVQGPVAFTNSWGSARSGGRRHQGVDMLSPRGTPVVANVSGTVKVNNSSLGGIGYYLYGDDGNTYFGTHLSSRTGVTGWVERGTVVGYVGDSGNARGTNHLHFEIHPGGGGAINPYPTVSKYC